MRTRNSQGIPILISQLHVLAKNVLKLWNFQTYSPFLHYLLVPSLLKSVLETQVTKTTLGLLIFFQGWYWLPVFSILIVYKLGISRYCKNGNFTYHLVPWLPITPQAWQTHMPLIAGTCRQPPLTHCWMLTPFQLLTYTSKTKVKKSDISISGTVHSKYVVTRNM